MVKKIKSWEEYKRTATFNGKLYRRNISHYSTKERAEKDAKHIRKKMNKSVIVDKNKTGYFFWIRSNPKKKSKAKYVLPPVYKEYIRLHNEIDEREVLKIAKKYNIDTSKVKYRGLTPVIYKILDKKYGKGKIKKFLVGIGEWD